MKQYRLPLWRALIWRSCSFFASYRLSSSWNSYWGCSFHPWLQFCACFLHTKRPVRLRTSLSFWYFRLEACSTWFLFFSNVYKSISDTKIPSHHERQSENVSYDVPERISRREMSSSEDLEQQYASWVVFWSFLNFLYSEKQNLWHRYSSSCIL